MSAKRLRMRQLREILRLKFEVGLSHRAIVRDCGVGLGTVTDYLQRVEPRVTGAVDLPHPSRTERRHDFVGAELRSGSQRQLRSSRLSTSR